MNEGTPTSSGAPRTVRCVKFQKEVPGPPKAPWPGELGQCVFEQVSKDGWKLWEERMKMILNEYRLMPWQKEAQELIAKQMEDFFFAMVPRFRQTTCRSRRSSGLVGCRPLFFNTHAPMAAS